MANYQNQYGAVPASKDPIQKEMDLSGDTTGTGDVSGGATATQVIADDYHGTTTTTDTTGVGGASHGAAGEDGDQHHHKKKGIIEKIKDRLPGTHHHHNK